MKNTIRPAHEISSVEQLQTEEQKVTDEINQAWRTSTTKTSLSVGFSTIPQELNIVIKKKNRTRRRAQLTRSPDDMR